MVQIAHFRSNSRTPISSLLLLHGEVTYRPSQLLPLLKQPEERRHGANVQGVGAHRHDVVPDPGDLGKQRADHLGAGRHLDVEHLLHGQAVGLLVAQHGHVVQPVKVGQRLDVRLVLNQLLRADR